MLKLYRSSEDFTNELVQLEILQNDQGIFRRDFRRIVVNGHFKKAKMGWVRMNMTPEQFKKCVAAQRNGKPYKLYFEKRFLCSAPCNPNIGPR